MIKPIAKSIAPRLNETCPDITTLELRKNKRGDKVFIDYLRNDYVMTVIAAYSLRAYSSAPAEKSIKWDELRDKSLEKLYFLSYYYRGCSFIKTNIQNRSLTCIII